MAEVSESHAEDPSHGRGREFVIVLVSGWYPWQQGNADKEYVIPKEKPMVSSDDEEVKHKRSHYRRCNNLHIVYQSEVAKLYVTFV